MKQEIKDFLGLDSNGYMIGYYNESMIPIVKNLITNEENIFSLLISEEIVFSEDKDL